jgi:hypothetical protein
MGRGRGIGPVINRAETATALNQDWLRRFGFLPITISNRAKRQKYKVFRGLRPDQDAWWIRQNEAENDNILNLH